MPEEPAQPQGRQPTPEEIEALKEKVKNMSPEELKEFQKKQCVFCQIISGKIQAKKIYEDDKSIGILDINPANPGHVLLLPKEHYSVMPQIPEEEVVHLFMVAKFLSNVVLKTLEATGTNIIVANGPAAGQRAQHFMIHVIPRKEGDGIKFELPQKKHSDSDLNTVAEKIREKLAALLKVKKEELVKKEVKPEVPIALPEKEVKPEAPKMKPPKPKVVEAVVKEEVKAPKEEKPEAKKPKRKKRKKKEAAPTAEVKVIVEPGVKVVKKPARKKKAKPKKEKEEAKEKEKPAKEGEDLAVDLDDIARVLGI